MAGDNILEGLDALIPRDMDPARDGSRNHHRRLLRLPLERKPVSRMVGIVGQKETPAKSVHQS